jgi:hypothetical protein
MRDIAKWSPLQVRLAMAVGNAKFEAFADAVWYSGELVRDGFLTRVEAADMLQEIAVYNQLSFEYGQDAIQSLMANGLTLRETTAA